MTRDQATALGADVLAAWERYQRANAEPVPNSPSFNAGWDGCQNLADALIDALFAATERMKVCGNCEHRNESTPWRSRWTPREDR